MRPPPYEQRGNFETIEVYAPVQQVQQVEAVEPPEPAEPRDERTDIAVIGPIAALVLALTISTLILEHPAARAVAAGLATLGLIAAVVLMLMGKRPQPGRHVARHAIDPAAEGQDAADQQGTVRIASHRNTPDRNAAAPYAARPTAAAPPRPANAPGANAPVWTAPGWSTTDPRGVDPRTTDPRATDWRR